MERSCKSWGEKISLFQNDLCEVSLLKLRGMERCSWHRHRSKWNLFYVVSGSIEIKTGDGVAQVNEGQVFTTLPVQQHEFRTPLGPAMVLEIMYVRYEAEDIERETVGGQLLSREHPDTHKIGGHP